MCVTVPSSYLVGTDGMFDSRFRDVAVVSSKTLQESP